MLYTGYMSDDQFHKLYRLMQQLVDNGATKDDISTLHKKLDDIYTVLDKQSELLDTDETERLALSKQVDRHDDWIERAADNIGVRYVRSN